jgi:hypothetical protein
MSLVKEYLTDTIAHNRRGIVNNLRSLGMPYAVFAGLFRTMRQLQDTNAVTRQQAAARIVPRYAEYDATPDTRYTPTDEQTAQFKAMMLGNMLGGETPFMSWWDAANRIHEAGSTPDTPRTGEPGTNTPDDAGNVTLSASELADSIYGTPGICTGDTVRIAGRTMRYIVQSVRGKHAMLDIAPADKSDWLAGYKLGELELIERNADKQEGAA